MPSAPVCPLPGWPGPPGPRGGDICWGKSRQEVVEPCFGRDDGILQKGDEGGVRRLGTQATANGHRSPISAALQDMPKAIDAAAAPIDDNMSHAECRDASFEPRQGVPADKRNKHHRQLA